MIDGNQHCSERWYEAAASPRTGFAAAARPVANSDTRLAASKPHSKQRAHACQFGTAKVAAEKRFRDKPNDSNDLQNIFNQWHGGCYKGPNIAVDCQSCAERPVQPCQCQIGVEVQLVPDPIGTGGDLGGSDAIFQ